VGASSGSVPPEEDVDGPDARGERVRAVEVSAGQADHRAPPGRRRSFTSIAAVLGVSEAAVRARVGRLTRHGILQIVGVTDPLKLGFHQMAMVAIRCEGALLQEVAAAVAEFPEVSYVVITAGTYDLLVVTVCEDAEDLLRFLTEKIRRVPGVRDTETFVYLRMVKQAFQWGTR
jgi:Lrp/AsnC family transcriptional regulator for asnA, asnC and gidA